MSSGTMKLLLLVALVPCLPPCIGSALNADTKKLYQNIVSGRGLYSPYDRVTVLNSTDFERTVFSSDSHRAWIVKFYNSWCGHCLRFSSLWKSFAWDITGWKKVVGVGAVDCSNEVNGPLCRDYAVFYYPMLKLFPAGSAKGFLGDIVIQPNLDNSIEQFRHELVTALKDNCSMSEMRAYNGTLEGLWEESPPEVRTALLVFEDYDSYGGPELVLDMISVKEVVVKIVRENNGELLEVVGGVTIPQLFGLEREGIVERINTTEWTREEIYAAARSWLGSRGVEVKALERREELEEENADFGEVEEFLHFEHSIKSKLKLQQLSDTVFQLDIERALKHTLTHEIPTKKLIEGEVMVALKRYLEVLGSHFPFGERGLRYLREINEVVGNRSTISGEEFEEIVGKAEDNHQPVYLEPSGWVGCRGSLPHLRGFPCGLWLLFHTLTVHSPPSSPPTAVLDTVLGYVKHFFGCTDCSQHFQQMASAIDLSVKTADDSVLWLWEAHNAANRRLGGDPKTEDPRHPKVQFPPPSLCPSCYTPDHSFSRPDVLHFLHSMFHNISYLLLDELPRPSISSPIDLAENDLITSDQQQNKPSLIFLLLFLYYLLY